MYSSSRKTDIQELKYHKASPCRNEFRSQFNSWFFTVESDPSDQTVHFKLSGGDGTESEFAIMTTSCCPPDLSTPGFDSSPIFFNQKGFSLDGQTYLWDVRDTEPLLFKDGFVVARIPKSTGEISLLYDKDLTMDAQKCFIIQATFIIFIAEETARRRQVVNNLQHCERTWPPMRY